MKAAAPDFKKNVVLGLGDEDARRIKALQERGEFFWLDLDLDSAGAERLGELLRISEHVLKVLRDLSSTGSAFRRSYLDEARVVFPFVCIRDPEISPLGSEGMKPCEVQVLVEGDHVVTVHHGPCEPLRELAVDRRRVVRSEQHLVYTVLESLVGSVFESLARLSAQAERIEGEFAKPRTGRRHLVFIREGRARLNHLRGHLAPQLSVFERVADEIPDVKGLSGDPHRYFVNIRAQLGHAVNSVDACNDALSGMLNMGLNRMTFLFTVVATLFLPITFLSGFFGQNFQWFLDRVTSATSFWLLGIGSMLLSLLASLWVIYRQLGPREAPNRSRSS